MLGVDRLIDQVAVDAWLGSLAETLAAAPSCEYGGDIAQLRLRCEDTLHRYNYDPEVKYRSLVDLLNDLDEFVRTAPGILPADVTSAAHALVHHAERRRYVNG
jgi:hypothetical protein